MYVIEDVQQWHKHLIAELARGGAHVDDGSSVRTIPTAQSRPSPGSGADRKLSRAWRLAAADALGLDRSPPGGRRQRRRHRPARASAPERVGSACRPSSGGRADVVSVPDRRPRSRTSWPPRPTRATRCWVRAAAFPVHATEVPASTHEYAAVGRRVRTIDPARLHAAADHCSIPRTTGRATVFACGNGGSASIANHLQCDHVKGAGTGTDLRARVFSLSTNIELFSAIANDTGYEHVFEHQLASVSRPGDLLITVSSSGSSPNIVRAVEWASAHGIRTIALTGFGGGRSREPPTCRFHVGRTITGYEDAPKSACTCSLSIPAVPMAV